jgi:hypothetical protein
MASTKGDDGAAPVNKSKVRPAQRSYAHWCTFCVKADDGTKSLLLAAKSLEDLDKDKVECSSVDGH